MGDTIQIEACHSGDGQNPDTILPLDSSLRGNDNYGTIQTIMRHTVSIREGAVPPLLNLFPFSYSGEGDKGDEVVRKWWRVLKQSLVQ